MEFLPQFLEATFAEGTFNTSWGTGNALPFGVRGTGRLLSNLTDTLTRPDLLPPSYITELSKLQIMFPQRPGAWSGKCWPVNLAANRNRFFDNWSAAAAAASLAQVHAAILPDGQEWLLKFSGLASLLWRNRSWNTIFTSEESTDRPVGKGLRFCQHGNDFAFTLRNELDYRREGRNADRFREEFC
jgi:ubiquinone biosynthesis protein